MVDLNRAALMADYARFRVQRRFSGARNLFDQAQKTWTVAPPETIETPPSIVLEGSSTASARWNNGRRRRWSVGGCKAALSTAWR
ncbi:hypothetical protein ACFOOP_12110 [Marinicaulis aureus]|uniref:Uncharacterized protein n=1 Tax=Hyphococcus aureus TaxID=2666033 RepID=A0ABW1KZH4_9PROT